MARRPLRDSARRRGRTVRPHRPDRAEPGLREHDRVRERHPVFRVFNVEYASFRQPHTRSGDAELRRRSLDKKLARPLRGLHGGVARHESHARGVRAEVDRRQVRVRRDDTDVERIDPENLGHDVSEHGVAPLPDVGRSAEDRDTAPRSSFSCTPDCGIEFQ